MRTPEVVNIHNKKRQILKEVWRGSAAISAKPYNKYPHHVINFKNSSRAKQNGCSLHKRNPPHLQKSSSLRRKGMNILGIDVKLV